MKTTNLTDDLVTCTIAAAERTLYERRCDSVYVSNRGERLLGFDSAGKPTTESFEDLS